MSSEERGGLEIDRGSLDEPAPAPAPKYKSPRRVRKEARKLAREGRRVRRWYARRMSPVLRQDLERILAALSVARTGNDLSEMRRRTAQLTALLDGPLAYTKKSALREYAEQALLAVGIALLARL